MKTLLCLVLMVTVVGCQESASKTVVSLDTGATGEGDDAAAPEPGSCPPGASLGCVTPYSRKVCNDKGTAFVEIACQANELCLGADECVPALCVPGERLCTGLRAIGECRIDGSGYDVVETCGPGLSCEKGLCVSACNSLQKTETNVGCVYSLVDLGNFESEAVNAKTDKPVLVVVSNVSGSDDATVQILSRETGELLPIPAADRVVPKNNLKTFFLPLGQAQLTTAVNRDSWLLTSDQPITVTLLNPENGLDVRSNDATLLFPNDSLGTEYLVMGWESFWTLAQGLDSDGFPKYGFTSYVTVVATASGKTEVTVTPSTDVRAGVDKAGGTLSRVPSGQQRVHILDEGDVLNYAVEPRVGEGDLTGTLVTTDKPAAVFWAHNCGFVPSIDVPFCDHMEHQLSPINTWGRVYVADLFKPRSDTPWTSNENPGYYDVFRVMASRDGTVVNCEPAVAGCQSGALKRGQWVEYQASVSHLIKANNPVQVGHFMTGSNYPGHASTCGDQVKTGIGDPAFTIGVAVDQYLNDYVFLTPPGYSDDWVNVTHPVGAAITLDGQPLAEPEEVIEGTGFAVTRASLPDGVHRITSADAFGIMAYGYDCDVSYAYPGGMLLKAKE